MRKSSFLLLALLVGLTGILPVRAQYARLRPAEPMSLPLPCDGNSASFWWGGQLRVFTSIGAPLRVHALKADGSGEWESEVVDTSNVGDKSLWVEGVWTDEEAGLLFAWYHHEPAGLVPGSLLTAPKIGALVSFDGGKSVRDLGFILESGEGLNLEARNGFFVGGHGDFSVVLDRDRKFFYFYFTNYGGAPETQGVVAARMAFEDRFDPIGKVHKYHEGTWTEPGLGGRVTPIHRTVRAWENADPDSFWGPSVHWNAGISRFVMLLNRAQGEPGWAQEGIYVSFCADPEDPTSWTTPAKLLGSEDIPSWSTFYPQVLGLEPGGTDTEAGEVARFFLHGTSIYQIEFFLGGGHWRRRPPSEPSPLG